MNTDTPLAAWLAREEELYALLKAGPGPGVATAVAPRAQAVAALLADLQENARKLGEALGGTQGSSMTETLAQARQAAADLARDARSTRTDGSFPSVLSAMRGVEPTELERAWRLGLEPRDNTPS